MLGSVRQQGFCLAQMAEWLARCRTIAKIVGSRVGGSSLAGAEEEFECSEYPCALNIYLYRFLLLLQCF